MGFSVLFVCTGNSCRSPMAEVLARSAWTGAAVAAAARTPGAAAVADGIAFDVSSAGTHAEDGGRASAGALEVAREHGLDLEAFHGRRLTAELLEDADLVLVMEPAHRSLVLDIQPRADTKTLLLGELAGHSGQEASVPDPYGGPVESYRRTFQRLDSFIRGGLPRLLDLVARRADRS